MLFLLRPRQTWMPYALPRSRAQQSVYNEQLQKAYASTRRIAPSAPASAAASPRDPVAQLRELAELHAARALTDAEFAAAKAKVLDTQPEES